jgi:hypothetical protein
MSDKGERDQTAPEAIKQWRAAERTVAIARRGKLAAQVAAEAAQEAADAAIATAEASKTALAAAALAEESAARTAKAARLLVASTAVDLSDSEAETALAEVDEAEAHARYDDAVERAANRKGAPET